MAGEEPLDRAETRTAQLCWRPKPVFGSSLGTAPARSRGRRGPASAPRSPSLRWTGGRCPASPARRGHQPASTLPGSRGACKMNEASATGQKLPWGGKETPPETSCPAPPLCPSRPLGTKGRRPRLLARLG
ncbi:unnamed protein product [Rangifer tarandus platyrhynchus]|uniref:Uncharacterized protein n=2 Tax=Rangifer tarandus platyrhynchus TaxID=3082113 RepID=A0ABN9A4C2_RANTA|nr:unnamed protein product [Rangifer tarandus platyrhynchus]CAI9714219.1 unnamed protein product [Rangifer tarandus platyrhynchus]